MRALFLVLFLLVALLAIYWFNPHYRPGYQLRAHSAKALVLTCMDFRLIDDITIQLTLKGELNNYDQFIMAGASLGYNHKADWAKVFEEHVGLAKKLHGITHIYIIDHLQCGMYKNVYDPKAYEAHALGLHTENLRACVSALRANFPGQFQYKTYVMRLDGSLIKIDLAG